MVMNTNSDSVPWNDNNNKNNNNGAEFINVTEKNVFKIRQDWDWKQYGLKKRKNQIRH